MTKVVSIIIDSRNIQYHNVLYISRVLTSVSNYSSSIEILSRSKSERKSVYFKMKIELFVFTCKLNINSFSRSYSMSSKLSIASQKYEVCHERPSKLPPQSKEGWLRTPDICRKT